MEAKLKEDEVLRNINLNAHKDEEKYCQIVEPLIDVLLSLYSEDDEETKAKLVQEYQEMTASYIAKEKNNGEWGKDEIRQCIVGIEKFCIRGRAATTTPNQNIAAIVRTR